MSALQGKITSVRPVTLRVERPFDADLENDKLSSIVWSPRRPEEYEGSTPGEKVASVFREWNRLGPHFDFSDEAVEFIVNFEFAPLTRPPPAQLTDSVCRLPIQSGRLKDRFDPFTGKRLPDSERYRFDPSTGQSYEKSLHFEQGQYVEYLGEDMLYRLAPVRRIVCLVDPDWEPETEDDEPVYEYLYSIGNSMRLDPRHVRCSEEGVKLIYGFRPFVFQQWALLKIESLVRFTKDHDLDFKSFTFRKAALSLWGEWMDDPRNMDFKELVEAIEEANPGSSEKLVSFILSPFALMDDMSKDDREWNLAKQVNVYMYVSLFGSGFATAGICAAIQVISPALLLQWQVSAPPGATGSRGLGRRPTTSSAPERAPRQRE